MELIRPFSKISKFDAAIAGGKGASLGEMTQAGIPVPPGYVILSSAFEQFIEETQIFADIDSTLENVNHTEMESVEKASEKIQALIIRQKIPNDIEKEILSHFKQLNAEFVAVRSSATAEDSSSAAWAGQLDTFLNTTEKNVLENVKKCWASLFTPRAIFYRFEKNLHTKKISVAVVIQKMVQSEISGIGFSVHPVTQDYNQMIIEAGFGLGEAIVSGQITPDSYVVEKKGWLLVDKNVSEQARGIFRAEKGGSDWKDIPKEKGSTQKLNDTQILELAKLIVHIEKHYGFPVDIEWAHEKGTFYITQSRPITTLTKEKTKEETNEPSKPKDKKKVKVSKKDDSIFIRGIHWHLGVTRNMSFWHQTLSTQGHFRYSKDFGVRVSQQQLCITVDGKQTHVFTNPENMKEYVPAVMEAVSTKEKILELKKKYVQFAQELEGALERCLRDFSLEDWKPFGKAYSRMCAGLFLTTVIGREGGRLLEVLLEKKGYSEQEIPAIISIITYPSQHTPLFDSQLDLLKLAKYIQSARSAENEIDTKLKEWLEKHGYIPVNFNEEPWTMKEAHEQLRAFLDKNCDKELEEILQSHEERIKAAQKKLKEINDSEITTLALAVQEGTYLNEYRKNIFSRVSLHMRPLFETLQKKAKLSEWRDCYYFTHDELGKILNEKPIPIQKTLEERKVVGYYTDAEGKDIFLSPEETQQLCQYIQHQHGQAAGTVEKARIIKGFPANHGKVRGIARIILGPKDFHKLKPTEIIVTTMTSVDFVPLMEKAAAFVTNEGGITSHASIVSREMNKPCIIGTKNATQLLKNGDLVEVDATKGIVHILGHSSPHFLFYSRDFCLTAIQIATTCETAHKPWFVDPFPFHPYIVGERAEGTVHMYYNTEAWKWLLEQLKKQVKKDKSYLEKIEKNIVNGIAYIQPIYEQERALELNELQKFMDSYIKAYPWIEAMWVLYRATPEELGADNSNIQKLRVRTDKLSAGMDTVIRKSLQKIYPELGKLSSMLTVGEVRSGKIPSQKELEKRNKGYYQVDNELWVGATRKEVEKKFGIRLERVEAPREIKEIKGDPASPGKATGKVCRVMGHDDFGKIKKGEILVSPMTMPDFLHEMKKAAAIITDEGGLMSHAAITAREMKIPCIVGTKIATAALNDGDGVEVDADNGIVRILDNSTMVDTIDLSQYQLFDEGGRAVYALALYAIVHEYGDNHATWPLNMGAVTNTKNHIGKFYTFAKDNQIHEWHLERFMKNKGLLQELEDHITRVKTETVKKLQEQNPRKLSNHQLNFVTQYFFNQFVEILRAAGTLRSVDHAILPKLREVFQNRPHINTCIQLASIAERPSFVQQEENALLEAAITLKKSNTPLDSAEAQTLIQNICDRYCWSSLGYFNEKPRTKEDYLETIREYLTKSPFQIKQKKEEKNAKDRKEKTALLSGLDKQGKILVHIASSSAYLKDYYKSSFNEMQYYAEPYFEEITKRLKKPISFVKDLLPNEIEDLLAGKEIDEEKIKQRVIHNVTIGFEGKHLILSGKEAKAYEEKYLMIKDTNEKEFKGRSASPGYGRGKVKVILSPADFSKMKKGDIIVARNTSPDFVPIMKKAAAIIAEEGGLTTHVSVVSREMGIPCVVGIVNATALLRDNDLVEVDANTGIVRILSRK